MSATPPLGPASLGTLRPFIARTGDEGHRQATWLELFFDLCFVVAVAALARAFHDDPTWHGALTFAGLFVPLWWAWMGFAWFANTFDNDDAIYRVLTLGGMLSVIWMATSVESAALGDTTAFALSYIVLRGFLLLLLVRALASAGRHPDSSTHAWMRAFLGRYVAGNALGMAVWAGSLALDDTARYLAWGVGLAIEIASPYVASKALPHGDARRDLYHWDHIRERYGLFTIIVLGESVLAVSIGVGEVGWSAEAMLTASLAFVVAASLWWMYFDRTGRAALEGSRELAFVWGYAHFAVFAGIAALGVGAELLIAASADAGGAEGAVASLIPIADVATSGTGAGGAIVAGGLAAFWGAHTVINLSNLGFRVTPAGRAIIASRVAVVGLVVALAAWGELSPEVFMAITAAGMVAVNIAQAAAVRAFAPPRAPG